MVSLDTCLVTFVTGSLGPHSAPEQVTLRMTDGEPPGLLTNPTSERPGTWRRVERNEPGPLVYQRLARERAHP